jgi:hypothetical protein
MFSHIAVLIQIHFQQKGLSIERSMSKGRCSLSFLGFLLFGYAFYHFYIWNLDLYSKNVNICFLKVQVFCPEAIWEIGHESSLYFSCDPFVLLKYTSFYANVSASLSLSLSLSRVGISLCIYYHSFPWQKIKL